MPMIISIAERPDPIAVRAMPGAIEVEKFVMVSGEASSVEVDI